MEEAAAAGSSSMAPESSYSNTSYPYPSQAQSQTAASSFQQTTLAADQHSLPPISLRSNDDIRTSMSTAAPMPVPMPMPGPSRDYRRERDRRRNRHGSRSSSDVSYSSSSSSSYLDISRWYPNFGRSGGILKTFFQTPSEHRQRARRRQGGRKKKGILGFGNGSSSSSVNSDMAYGMGFVRKPKSRNFSPRDEHARASGRETSDRRPRLPRRQTDEEIMEIGRKLAKVARDQNMEDLRAGAKRPAGQVMAAANSWDKFHLHNTGGLAGSSRGLPPSSSQRHDTSSSDDEGWESASEDESSSDESSGLAYGAVEFDEPLPPKPSVSRQPTSVSVRPPDRKSSAVDPKLFGPFNSLRGIVNTPCGFGDRNAVYPAPVPSEPYRTSTAESASIEARPLQTVYPVPTSDPELVEAARTSGSVVPPQPSYSRDQSYPSGSTEAVPIQAPKPIAPFPMHMYEEERIRDESPESRERRRFNPADSKTFVETALVTAGVAGAAVLAAREKNKDKEHALRHGDHENYGHDDHRENETKVEDSIRAKELALEKEIERLERVLAERNKAREQRNRDSKQESGPARRRMSDSDEDRDMRRRGRGSRRSEPDQDYDYDRREEGQPETRRVPDDAFRTRDSPSRPSSPFIIDVTPAPSPDPDQMERRSRRDSFEDEMREAARIYDESNKSTAPISAVDMAAAIAATEQFHPHDEPERGRTNAKQRDAIQEEADRYYHARRMAEREVRSRSRSHSPEPSVVGKYGQDHGAEIPRIVTPPEMLQKPQKNMYSEPNADVKFDHLMSPEDHAFFRPKECPVRDPSAERPRPVLTLVIPTPVPTPSPEGKRKSLDTKAPETVLSDVPDIVIGPRGEIIEVVTASPDSKRVSWGPSETKQYEVESPERSRERPSAEFSETHRHSNKGDDWDGIPADVAGAAAAAAFLGDDEPEQFEQGEQADINSDIPLDTSRSSPPRDRKVLPKGLSFGALDEEPEDAPPAPGPKPASPRTSQMPGAFADDLDFAATLAAGLQESGFDPNIVIDDETYRRRDSPPGLYDPAGVYMEPYAETVLDLGVLGIDQGVPVREPGHIIGEVAETPAREKEPPLDVSESAPASPRQSASDEGRSIGHDDTEAAEEPVVESPKALSEELRKVEKDASAAQLAEEEERLAQPIEAGDDIGADVPSLEETNESSKKPKRSSSGWDDADTPVNDRRVSLPVDTFDDVEDAKASDDAWEEAKGSRKAESDFKGYDVPEEHSALRRERRKEERRRLQLAKSSDKNGTSAKSATNDDASSVPGRDDSRPGMPAPDDKKDNKADKMGSKEEKRGGGGFWGLLKGSNGADGGKESKKGSAGTLGAGAGLTGAALGAAVAAGSLPSSSDAAEAPLKQEEPFVFVDVNQPAAQRADSVSEPENLLLDDPDIIPRIIKPAIDPQYGDLLPLPPSPGGVDSSSLYEDDELPPLPDSRPATPPGQEKALLRERSESSQKRPAHATHTRRRSAQETPTKSPSHTAIPIQFRMGPGPRTAVPPPPGNPHTPPTSHPSPAALSQETFPTTKRPSRPTSWDRPMSWDTSREFRPLYLLERSRGGTQENDDTPGTTPLPPSSESSAPESVQGEELKASPLIVDTAASQAAPLGSEESTPRGIGGAGFESPASAKDFEYISPGALVSGQTDYGLQNPGKDPEMTPVEFQSRSSLAESSYATPFEYPRDRSGTRPSVEHRESTESTSDFQDALYAPADDEDTDTGSPKNRKGKKKSSQTPELEHAEEQEEKGYFPSVLSMLPAATLASVDAFLSRGKRGEIPTNVDDHTLGTQSQELPSEAQDQMADRGVLPRAEASEVNLINPVVGPADQGQSPPAASPRKSSIDTPHGTIDASDTSLPNESPAVHMHPERSLATDDMRATEGVVRDVSGGNSELPALESPAIETTELISPSWSSHTIDDSLTTTSQVDKAEDMEPILETPADTVDWVAESSPSNKQSIPDAPQLPVTAESSVLPPFDAQRDVCIQDEPSSKAIEEPSSVIEPVATSPNSRQSNDLSQWNLGGESSTISGEKGKERDDLPYHPPEESMSESVIHEPAASPVQIESPGSPGAHSRIQSQDESTQADGKQMKSSAFSRRLRSSRAGISSSNSTDEYMSSDAANSGEDVPTSPRSTTSSGLRSAGRNYKKTRSLRSSRRSSMASSQGSSHENEAVTVEEVAEQPIAAALEQIGPEVVEEADRRLDVEQLEPAEPAMAGDSVPQQREIGEEPLPSQSDNIEETIPSPYEIVEDSSTAIPEIVDQPPSQEADIFGEPSSTLPEVPETPVSSHSRTFSELMDSPETHLPRGQEENLSQIPRSGESDDGHDGSENVILIKGPESPEPGTFHDNEVSDVQTPDLPERSTPGSNAAVETAREVLAEELPQEQGPRELADSPVQPSESDKVTQDDPQQQVDVSSPLGPEQEVVGQSDEAKVEEAPRDVTCDESPVPQIERLSELDQPTTQLSSEEEALVPMHEESPEGPPQEVLSTPVLAMEEESPDSSDKARDGVVIDEPIQSTGAAIPAESDSIPQATEAPAEPMSPTQAEPQLEQLPSESKDTSLDQGMQPQVTNATDSQEMNESLEPEISVVQSNEPSKPIEAVPAMEPIALPVPGDIPAAIPVMEPVHSTSEIQDRLESALDDDEVAHREAEAALIREEEAELARLRQKKKRKSKDNKRISVLTANAERRAEKADTAPPTPSSRGEGLGGNVSEGDVVEPQLEGAISGDHPGESILPQTGEPVVAEQSASMDRSTVVPEPEQILTQPEDVPQVEDTFPETLIIPEPGQLDPPPDQVTSPAEQEPEPGLPEDSAELARREAEAVLTQKEEADLARLVKKKNPSKKDKARIKTLKANAERRAQELVNSNDMGTTGPSHTEGAASEDAESQLVQSSRDVPLSQLEGTSYAEDSYRNQPEEASQPQIEEVSPSQAEIPSPHADSSIEQPAIGNTTQELPQDQLELPREVTGNPESQLDDSSQAPFEPISSTETPQEQETDNLAGSTVADSNQPVVTELQQELEPVSPTEGEKSTEDTNKTGERTFSATEMVTPLVVLDPSVVDSRELSESAPLPTQDSEAAPIPDPSEVLVIEQGQSSVVPVQEDTVSGHTITGEVALAQPTESSAPEPQDQASSEPERLIPSPTALEQGDDPAIVPEPEQITRYTDSQTPFATKDSQMDQEEERSTVSEASLQEPTGSTTPVALGDVQQEAAFTDPVDESEGVVPIEDRSMPLEFASQPELASSPGQELHSTTTPCEPESAQEEDSGISAIKGSEEDENSRTKTLSGTSTPIVGVGETTSPTEPVEVQASEPASTGELERDESQTFERNRENSLGQTPEASGLADPTDLPEAANDNKMEGSSTAAPVVSEPEKTVTEPEKMSPSSRMSDGWGFLAGAIAGIGAAVGMSGEEEKPFQHDEQIQAVTSEQGFPRGVATSKELPSQDLEFADEAERDTNTTLKDVEEPLQNIGRDQPREQTVTDVVMTEPGTDQEPASTQEDLLEPDMIESGNSETKNPLALDLGSEIVGSSGSQSPLYDDIKQDVAEQQTSKDPNTAELDLQPVDSDRTFTLPEREIIDQPRLEESPHHQIEEEAPVSETIAKSELESKEDDTGDTFIVAGGRMPEGVSGSTPVQQNWPISAEQAKVLAGDDYDHQPSLEPESHLPADDKILEEPFATPMERPLSLPDDSEPIHTYTSGDQTEKKLFGISDKNSGVSPPQSLENEPGTSISVPQLPIFEESLEQRPAMESVDTKEMAEEASEGATEGFSAPSPKKLSKKEKRKAKKRSVSVSEPEVPASEDEGQQAIEESAQPRMISEQDQAPADWSATSGTQQVDPSLQGSSAEGKSSGEMAEAMNEQDSERSFDVQEDMPMESKLSEPQETAVEDTPVLARKLSKKERRKAKKAASAWVDDVLEPSQPQTPLAEETQPQDIPATPSPIFESDPVQARTSIESRPAQDVTESTETLAAKDVVDEDEWAAPLSRKNSEKDKQKGKQHASEAAADSQISLTEEPHIVEMSEQVPETQATFGQILEDTGESPINHRSAEMYVPVAEEMLEQTTEDYGGPTGRVDNRSAEMYIPEAQGTLGNSTEHSDHRSAELYVPGTQETPEDIADDIHGLMSPRHRSAEVYVPLAQEVHGQATEDAISPKSRPEHRFAEMYVPESETGVEGDGAATIEDSWKIPRKRKDSLVIGSSIPTTPAEEEAPGTSGGAQSDSEPSNIEGRELQRKEPSPDTWDHDDYFQPKHNNLGGSPREAFNRVEINPAVARELNTSSDKRMYDRPLVGLGLIQRHSSIFRESDGHTPRLLTMASDNASTDSLAIQDDPSEPDNSTVMDSMPVQENMSTYHDEPTTSATGRVMETAQRFTFSNLNDRPRTAGSTARLSRSTSQETSRLDGKDVTKKGGVAALAEKFGGIKKAHGQGASSTSHGRETQIGDENNQQTQKRKSIWKNLWS